MQITIEKRERPLDEECKVWLVTQKPIEISDEDLLKLYDRILELRGEKDDRA